MEKIKLIEILKTFTPEELTRFEKFITSPFHNGGRNLLPYFKILKKFHPDYSPDKKEFYRLIYPGKKYDDAVMRRLNSFLFSMAEQFLIQLSLEENTFEKDLHCLEQYMIRGLSGEFIKKSDKMKDKLNSSKFFLENFFQLNIRYNFIVSNFYADKSLKKFIDHTIDCTESGIMLLVVRLIRNNIIKSNMTKATAEEMSSALTHFIDSALDTDSLFKSLENNSLIDNRIYKVLYYLNKCFKEKNNIEHFYDLKKAFLESIHLFSREDRYYIFNDMLSWCIIKQQEGNTGFTSEELNVIKLMREHNSLTGSEKEPMNIIFFRNVIFTALDLNEVKWIEKFVKTSINTLRPEFRENMRYYSLIYIEYHKKNFEKCMEYFSYLKSDNSIFKRDLRILMLKVYYELNYFENAHYLLDSTRHYLSGSREISQTHKTRDSNFTKYYTKLLKITKDTDASEIEILKNDILNEINVESKRWLLRKVEEKSRK